MKRYFFLCLYYGFARYLPKSLFTKPIGYISMMIQNVCARNLFLKCGKVINIKRMANFGNGVGIELGENSCIGIHCHVPNDIYIGNHVVMGPYCYILENSTHDFSRIDISIGAQSMSRVERRTKIGGDVWLRRQCIMISGKYIGNHVVIGAGSVICKDVPDLVVAAGNPIRVVRQRQ